MPRIVEYQQTTSAQAEIGGRRAQAGDTSGFGSEIGQAFSDVDSNFEDMARRLEETASRQEVSDAHAKLAKFEAEKTVELAQAAQAAAPGDTSFATKFNEQVSKDLEQFQGQAQTPAGRQAWQTGSATLSAEFYKQSGLFQVKAAGEKAVLDFKVLQDSYQQLVQNDPTQFFNVAKKMDEALNDPDGIYATMPGLKRKELSHQGKQALAESAIDGLIQQGASQLAIKQLLGGTGIAEFIDPDKKKSLLSYADVEDSQRKAMAKEAEKERIDVINMQLNNKFMEHKLTWADVKAAHPTNKDGAQDVWMARIRQQIKDQQEAPAVARTNPAIFNDLRERIALPYGDPRKIDSTDVVWKYYGKGLSEADANRLERRLIEDKTDTGQKYSSAESEFLKNMRPQLDKTTLFMPDSEGGGRMQAYTTYVRDKAEEMRKAGKDPRDLFKPDSPDYAGKSIPMFQTGAQIKGAEITRKINQSIGKPQTPVKRKSLDDIFK